MPPQSRIIGGSDIAANDEEWGFLAHLNFGFFLCTGSWIGT